MPLSTSMWNLNDPHVHVNLVPTGLFIVWPSQGSQQGQRALHHLTRRYMSDARNSSGCASWLL
jgi:hypothetical protein